MSNREQIPAELPRRNQSLALLQDSERHLWVSGRINIQALKTLAWYQCYVDIMPQGGGQRSQAEGGPGYGPEGQPLVSSIQKSFETISE